MKRLLVWMVASLVTAGVVSAAWAQQQGGPHYGPHMWTGGSWMFPGLMLIVCIAAIVIAVVFIGRSLGGSVHGTAHHPPTPATPLDILKERFARGEVDKEEFEERRRVLGE